MKIAIFGGTFDPIHNAHLFIASDTAEQLSIEKVLLVVANIPPHKELGSSVSSKERLFMTELSVKNNSLFEVIDYEITKGGVSYTIDTVNYIYDKYKPDEKIYIIIGADLVPELYKWHKFEELNKIVNFVVYNRNNETGREYLKQYPDLLFVDGPGIDISSTSIRNRIREKKSVRYLIPEEVYLYIRDKKLYL